MAPTVLEEERKLDHAHRLENRVEPALVAVVTNLGEFTEIHLTKASPGEQLPPGLICSKAGFLLNSQVREVVIDAELVKKNMEYFRKYVVIAYFVGRKQSGSTLREWLVSLAGQVGEPLSLGRDLERGFFQIIAKSEHTTKGLDAHPAPFPIGYLFTTELDSRVQLWKTSRT
jgi:hypothetical protein